MSSDKNRSERRRMALLRRAVNRGSILINCPGGMAFQDRDLQRLLRDGHLRLARYRFDEGESRVPAPKRFWSEPCGSLHGQVQYTRAVITDAGRAALRADEKRR